MLCVNMVHIAPWAATEGLMRGAAKLLAAEAAARGFAAPAGEEMPANNLFVAFRRG